MTDKKRTPVAQSQQNVLGMLQAVQPITTGAVSETVARQKINIGMFQQAILDKRKINAEKSVSQSAYTAKASGILDKNAEAQTRLNTANANPFNDLIALFTGDPSRQDIINEQKVLQGQMARVHRDNVNVTSTFNAQLQAVNQGLSDQLGLSKLRQQQGDELEDIINRETKTSLAVKEVSDKTLEGFSISMLENELEDPTSKFPPGFVTKWLMLKKNEALDLSLKKRKLKNGGKLPTKGEVLDTLSVQDLKREIDTMNINAANTSVIDGFTFTRASLQTQLKDSSDRLIKSGNAFDSMTNDFALTAAASGNLQSDLSRVEFDVLPLKNKTELTAGITALSIFDKQRITLTDKLDKGQKISTSEFATMQSTRALASTTYQRALHNAAVEQAKRFENEKANKAAVDYYVTGNIPSANNAREIAGELSLNETPDAIAEAGGIVIGRVIGNMAQTLSANMVTNFQDNTQADGGLSGTRPADVNLQMFLSQSKSGKLNSQVAWQRMISEKSGLPKGEEQNRWVADISNQLIAAKSQIGITEFLKLPEISGNVALRNALVTTGGSVRNEILNADVDTLDKIVQTIALVSAKQIEAGQMDSDLGLAVKFIEVMKSEAVQNVAKQELENPAIEVQSFLRGLYKSNAASSYLGIYIQKLNSIDTVGIEKRVQVLAAEQAKQRESAINILENPDSFGGTL